MLEIEQIDEWIGLEVLDVEGEHLGKLDEIYYPSGGGEAVLVSVKSGLLGRHSRLVPLQDAAVGRHHVRLAFTAERIDRAGAEADPQDVIDSYSARRVAEAYGLDIGDGDFASGHALSDRRQAAEKARKSAEELEEEAKHRAVQAAKSQQAADEAQEDAAENRMRAAKARAAAEQGYVDADRLTPPEP